ncbi:hypothetical protein V1358_09520 [Pseudoalteromonas sp. YIC-656]|uniref:hypothetical protein n=1 Tax=Pseudoalteromonas pernae TaxID=3118054 RepID=UPI0032422E2F
MKKLGFVSAFVLIVVLAIVYLMIKREIPAHEQAQIQKSTAPSSGLKSTFSNASPDIQINEFEPTPKPEVFVSSERCEQLQRSYYEQHRGRNNEYLAIASQLRKQGESVDNITLALLHGGVDWITTDIWRIRTQIREATLKHQHAIKHFLESQIPQDASSDEQKQHAQLLQSQLKTLDLIVANAHQPLGNTPHLNLDYVYNTVFDMRDFQLLTFSDTSTQVLVDSVTAMLEHVDAELLNSPELSPIHHFIGSLLFTGKTEAATLLAQRYPQAFKNDSIFINRSQQATIEILTLYTAARKDKSMVAQLLDAVDLNRMQRYLPDDSGAKMKLNTTLLANEGFKLNVSPFTSIPLESPPLEITLESEHQFTKQEQSEFDTCSSQNEWLTERTKTPQQWQQYETSPFIDSVINSPEFKACENSKAIDAQALVMGIASEILGKGKGLEQWQNLTMDDIDVSSLSDDKRTALALIATSIASGNEALSREQIVGRLANMGLTPSFDSTEILSEFVNQPELTMWLETLTDLPPDTALNLANVIAHRGSLREYKLIEPFIVRPDSQQLDPLYYLLQRDPFVIDNRQRSSAQFLKYLLETGYSVSSQHERQMVRMQTTNAQTYLRIIEQFPELAVGDPNDYFAVNCDNQK